MYLYTGGIRDPAPGEDVQDVINEAGKQEIALSLVSKFEGNMDDDGSMRAVFVRYRWAVCVCVWGWYTWLLHILLFLSTSFS